MSDGKRALDDIMADLLGDMPEGPAAAKFGVVIASLVRASGLEPGDAWCAVAATCAAAHEQELASLQVLVEDDSGRPHFLIFNSGGRVVMTEANAEPIGNVTKH